MSWLQGGLGRLLHSREQQKPTSVAAAAPSAAAATAAAATPTRAEKQKGVSSLLDRLPSPRSLAGKGQEPDAAQLPLKGASISPQNLLDLNSPGSAYAQLPCIQQLRPSRAAAEDLAAAVLAALPGVQLDSSWVVYSTSAAPKPASGRKAPALKAGGHICILPALQPPGYFTSSAAVVTFLQELQREGVTPLPGCVLAPLAKPKAKPTQTAPPAAAAAAAAAAARAAAVTAALQACGPGFEFLERTDSARDSTGSGDTGLVRGAAVTGAKRGRPSLLQQQQQRGKEGQDVGVASAADAADKQQRRPEKRSRHSLVESTMERKGSGASSDSPAAAAAAAAGTAATAGADVDMDDASQIETRRPSARGTDATAAAAAAAAAAAGSDSDSMELPDWRLLHRLQSLRSADTFVEGRVKLNRVDAKLESIRRAALVQGKVPSMSPEMAAPKPQLSKPPKMPSPVSAAALLSKPYSVDGRPPKHRAGGRKEAATNTFTAASDVKAARKLDSLLRAKEAAAAIKSAVHAGLPYEGTLEQRHHALRQQLRQQLPDGRVPCAEGLVIMQQMVSAQLPGARLDSEWLVYPSTPSCDSVTKLDILIRHTRLTMGHFRSYKSVVNFYVALTDLLMASKGHNSYYSPRPLCVPGLAVPPAVLHKEQYSSGRSPGEMEKLMERALKNIGSSFVRDAAAAAVPLPAAAAAAAAAYKGRGRSPGDGGPRQYPAGGTKAFAANAAAVAARQWQPPPLVTNLEPPRKGSSVLVLGMFYASEATAFISHDGLAQYRDRMRLAALHIKDNAKDSKDGKQKGGKKKKGRKGRRGSKDGSQDGKDTSPESQDSKEGPENSPEVRDSPDNKDSKDNPKSSGRQGSKDSKSNQDSKAGSSGDKESNNKGSSPEVREDEDAKEVIYVPVSFDRDHEVEKAQEAVDEAGRPVHLHVQGNFNSRRGAASVTSRFPGTRFTAVFCDYFRMPSGYAGDIYKPQLFTDFIPELVRRGALPAGVPVYLPNSPVLLEQLAGAGAFVDYGDVVAVPAHCYPLHEATRQVEAAGQIPASYLNRGQVRELVPGAEFIVVHYCGDATPPM